MIGHERNWPPAPEPDDLAVDCVCGWNYFCVVGEHECRTCGSLVRVKPDGTLVVVEDHTIDPEDT